MKIKFDVTGAVEKMTGFDKLEGKANLDAHFEIEFGADELGMIYEAQRALVPEVLNFVKELQKMQNENEKDSRSDDKFEILDLKDKIRNLEIALEGEKERHESTRKNRDEYFNKYIKALDNENERIKRETEEIIKRSQDSRKTQKQEEDDDELY